ncbi:hypothetical protein [Sphingomonas jaspsi]|uniref:hypothetical protein n=1 Tax=Sphingomonas jaspsi TaxID=392409 RepID=UPI0004B8662E|nr:hypothetical protein [Sphingomonas jaspsi]
MNKIWCLFSVANNYDQPDNNLEAWWPEKPSLETFSALMGKPLGDGDDDWLVAIVQIWAGKGNKLPHDDTRYRLEEVEARVRLT